MALTAETLRKIMPYAGKKADLFLPFLLKAMEEFNINTPLRQAAFLAQLGHESGQFRYVKELASGEAYEGRKDLGNTQKGDGKRYKGRGLIQITGRANYTTLSKAFGVDFVAKPELLETPEWACRSAAWFWGTRKLNELADKEQFITITKRINGGTNGLKDRQELYAAAKHRLC